MKVAKLTSSFCEGIYKLNNLPNQCTQKDDNINKLTEIVELLF